MLQIIKATSYLSILSIFSFCHYASAQVSNNTIELKTTHPSQFYLNYLFKDSPLTKVRHKGPQDHNLPHLDIGESFFDIISGQYNLLEKKNVLGVETSIKSKYKIGSKITPVNFYSHKMCSYTKETVNEIFTEDKRPRQDQIDLMNIFSNLYNQELQIISNSNAPLAIKKSKLKIKKLWLRFFSCLSHIESLGVPAAPITHNVANWPISYEISRQTLGDNYFKPPGVKFHIDNQQSNNISKLNIGLYQFSPAISGNIRSCVRKWNTLYPKHKVKYSQDKKYYALLLGAPLQEFNAFCGQYKVLESFFVQVNTQRKDSILSINANTPSDQRCISLHMSKSKAYNHFGPLQNSNPKLSTIDTGNMGLLLQCSLTGF